MLMPKRTKYRRVQRGRMKGAASRGNKVSYGEFGIQALEPGWITGNQIEAARVAMTRYTKRGGQVWIYKGEVLNSTLRSENPEPARRERRDRRPNDRRNGDRRGNGERRPYNNDRRSYNGERRPYNNNNTEGGNR